MEKNTAITISDSSTKPNFVEEVLSLDSTISSISTKRFAGKLLNSKTPSSIDKVVKWINDPAYVNIHKKTIYQNKFEVPQPEHLAKIKFPIDQNAFKKSNGLQHILGLNKKASMHNELFTSMDYSRKSSINFVHNKPADKPLLSCDNLEKLESPETCRKRELCSYLQLMNPLEQKQVDLIQNRRSVRVKNLNVLQAKKKLERKLRMQEDRDIFKENETTITNNSVDERCITMKSFKDLKINFFTSFSNNNEESLLKFNFVMPPKSRLNSFTDFEASIEGFVKNLKEEKFHFKMPPTKVLNKINDFDNIMDQVGEATATIKSRPKGSKNNKLFKLNGQFKLTHSKNKNFMKDNGPVQIKKNKFKIKLRKIKNCTHKLRIRDVHNMAPRCSKRLLKHDPKKMKTKKFINIVNKNSKNKILKNKNFKVQKEMVKDETSHLQDKRLFQDKVLSISGAINKIAKHCQVIKNISLLGPQDGEKINQMENEVTSDNVPQARLSSTVANILSTHKPKQNKNIDLVVFMNDLKDYSVMSEEHRRLLAEMHVVPSLEKLNEIRKKVKSSIDSSPISTVSTLHGFSEKDLIHITKFREFYDAILRNVSNGGDNDKFNQPMIRVDYISHKKNNCLSHSKDTESKEIREDEFEKNIDAFKCAKLVLEEKLTEELKIENGNVSEHEDEEMLEPVTESVFPSADENNFPTPPADNELEDIETSSMYSSSESPDSERIQDLQDSNGQDDIINTNQISPLNCNRVSLNENIEVKSLHLNLIQKDVKKSGNLEFGQVWDADDVSASPKAKHLKTDRRESGNNSSHSIVLNKENGTVEIAFYINFNLIVVQKLAVCLWNQTALGDVLGAQNLWIFSGSTNRLILNNECVRRNSFETVLSMENCVAYIELWTKEHKSELRQRPVTDVFAAIYFWRLNKLDKKVLQIENINGFADDVQYVVLKSSLNIVVSWYSVMDNKETKIRIYDIGQDFQKIINIRCVASVDHYVSSLHNIKDCDNVIIGCGERKITMWNIKHGYVVFTIELNDIKLSMSTLWVKCNRGILFIAQQCTDKEICLLAINGMKKTWKKLMSFRAPGDYDRVQGIYVGNGVLIAFYEQGILCWNTQTGQRVVEENQNETDLIRYFPSGKHFIMIIEDKVFVKHALTHLLTTDE